jgi:hypothetical protein
MVSTRVSLQSASTSDGVGNQELRKATTPFLCYTSPSI